MRSSAQRRGVTEPRLSMIPAHPWQKIGSTLRQWGVFPSLEGVSLPRLRNHPLTQVAPKRDATSALLG